jgi:hypothetical protein
MKNPFFYMGIPIFLLVLLWIFIEFSHRSSKKRQRDEMKQYLPQLVEERVYSSESLYLCFFLTTNCRNSIATTIGASFKRNIRRS